MGFNWGLFSRKSRGNGPGGKAPIESRIYTHERKRKEESGRTNRGKKGEKNPGFKGGSEKFFG